MTSDPPISNPRAVAARVVRDVVEDGRYLDVALEQRDATPPPGSYTSALIQELAYGTLRWHHQLAAVAALFLAKPLKPKDRDLYALLLIGLYQLRFTRVAPHAAVTETVAAAAALGKPWAKGLLNACLRAALRAPERIAREIERSPALAYSHPPWLIETLQRAYPERWPSLLAANNERPPMVLRVNCRRTAVPEYLALLQASGMTARVLAAPDSAIVLDKPVPVGALPGFIEGLVSVQDAAAQWAAPVLAADPRARVLDVCVAPGGKAAHILERRPDVELVGVDRDAGRLARTRGTFARLGLKARLIEGDAATPGAWWDGQPFDYILIDAPCSATGIIRRHPDIKVRRRPEHLSALTATQASILAGVWPCLRHGGKLLYATCSVLPEENQRQMEAFLARHPDATRAVVRSGVCEWQILPGESEMDGFYYASIRKT